MYLGDECYISPEFYNNDIGAGDVYDNDLGIVLPAVGGVVSAISSIFGGNDKDPGRLATNQQAYNLAVSGNTDPFNGHPSPLQFLLDMSGHGDPGMGWATSTAKNDAWNKYNSAKSALAVKPPQQQSYPVQTAGIIPLTVAGLSTGPLLLAGVAALGIVMLTRKGRR